MAVTTSNGNGFALYNGVKLPNIDSVWDKETYPYAYMEVSDFSQFGVNAVVYSLDLFDKPLVFDVDEMRGYAPCAYKSCLFVRTQAELDALAAAGMPLPAHGIWLEDGIIYTVEGENSYTPRPNTDTGFAALWTSYDVLSVADNSVYFAGSDPIPLDGMNVIEWDGDTTELVSSSANTHYKVSDVVLSASDLVGSVIAAGSEALVVPAEFVTNGEGYASIDTYVLSCQNEGVSFDGNTLPEKGLYFINAFDVHLPFFAYPTSGGGESTTQKHYCRVNGTVYEIKSGTARIDGTFCEVKSGTVLIDGTVYDFALN